MSDNLKITAIIAITVIMVASIAIYAIPDKEIIVTDTITNTTYIISPETYHSENSDDFIISYDMDCDEYADVSITLKCYKSNWTLDSSDRYKWNIDCTISITKMDYLEFNYLVFENNVGDTNMRLVDYNPTTSIYQSPDKLKFLEVSDHSNFAYNHTEIKYTVPSNDTETSENPPVIEGIENCLKFNATEDHSTTTTISVTFNNKGTNDSTTYSINLITVFDKQE